jgi:LAO/AO transport system kinase
LSRRTREADPVALAEGVLAGDRRAVARLISMVEAGAAGPHQAPEARLRTAAELLAPRTGRAAVLGVTGAPGVGKSTLCDRVVAAEREAGLTVGVLAVDPSSPFTGGALLGDRVRMQAHTLDQGVFIRSMATRGRLGGLAWATPQAIRILDAAGCQLVLVETAGVGQSEVEIAGQADTTVVVLAPGLGDAVQVAKAGVLEIADVLVVNKADRDGARRLVRDLREMLALGSSVRSSVRSSGWDVPVLTTVAERGEGVAELLEAVAAHRAHLDAGGGLRRRRLARVATEVRELALATLRAELAEPAAGADLDALAERVLAGEMGPHTAADHLLGRQPAAPAPLG